MVMMIMMMKMTRGFYPYSGRAHLAPTEKWGRNELVQGGPKKTGPFLKVYDSCI